MITSLDKLRNLHADGFDLDELLILSATADSLEAQYDYYGVKHPDWFKNAKDVLAAEVKSRIRGDLLKRKAEAESRLETLKTSTEKKAQLRKELEEIKSQLSA